MKQWTIAGFLALALAVGSTGPARANLITNGGFETGDFTGWTTDSFNTVECGSGGTGVSSHTGACAAALGAVGTPNSLKQTITTVPGGTYVLSFWEESDGKTPNVFQANWDGNTVLGPVLDDLAHGYPINSSTFTVVASTASTTVEFLGQNDNGFLGLDDVSVEPQASSVAAVPEPASLTLFGLGLGSLVGYQWRRRQRTVTK